MSPKEGVALNIRLKEWHEMRNRLLCAEANCLEASERKERRGAHKMEDITFKSDKFTNNQIISIHNGHLVSRWKAVQKLDFDHKEKSLAVV